MRSLGKGVLYAVVLITAALLLALLGCNLYLRSPGVRLGIAAALERRAGLEVSYRTISYLPWRGVKMSDVEVDHRQEISAITEEPFVEIDAVVAKINLWSLIDRPIQLGSVRMVRPQITTMQWPDGSIVFPGDALQPPAVIALMPTEDPPELATTGETPDTIGPVGNTGSEGAPTPPRVQGGGVLGNEEKRLQPSLGEAGGLPAQRLLWTKGILVEDVQVRDGGLTLLDPRGQRALLEIEGIDSGMDLEWLTSGADGVVVRSLGEVSVDRVSLLGLMQMTEVHSVLQLRNDGTLALPKIVAVSDGGTVEGEVIADPRSPGLPFSLRVSYRDVGVASLSRRAFSQVVFSRGAAEGDFTIEGFLRKTPTWRGQGRLEVNDAALARNGLLESFGRYVGLREFVELAFEEAKMVFEVKGPVIWFDDIYWKTENLVFKGLGAVGMNQQVKLAARLYFSPQVHGILQRIERQLPEKVIRESEQVEGREDFFRDFGIFGPFDRLQADFVGSEDRTLKEMLELLRNNNWDEETEKEPG